MSGLLEPLGLGQEAPADHSWASKTAQRLATTSVHDKCAKGPLELLSSSTRERNGDTSVKEACMVELSSICSSFACFITIRRVWRERTRRSKHNRKII